jgi:hypothetical protein
MFDATAKRVAKKLLESLGVTSGGVYAPTAATTALLNSLGITVGGVYTPPVAGLTPTAVKTAAYPAVVNDHVLVDANAAVGNFAVTLPAAPAVGSKVAITLVTDHATRKVTVARNSNLINGSTNEGFWDFLLEGDTALFTYMGGGVGWAVSPGYRDEWISTTGYTCSWTGNVSTTMYYKRNRDRTASFWMRLQCTALPTPAVALAFTPTIVTIKDDPLRTAEIYGHNAAGGMFPGASWRRLDAMVEFWTNGPIKPMYANAAATLAEVTPTVPATWANTQRMQLIVERIEVDEWAA